MSLKEAGHVIRIGTMAFVLPIWALATGFFVWEGMYLYAALMLVFGAMMGYGVYMNWKRIASDEKIDDERMQRINWKSGANAFWTVINAAIIFGIFGGFIAGYIPISQAELARYDSTIILWTGLIAYFGFRTYFLRYGLENEFWRID
jgi:hypothetical protein